MVGRKRWPLALAALALSGCALLQPERPLDELPLAKSQTATRHMAATANPEASKAAIEMMRQGGSALDAAIAAQAVLTLVEPQSSGIGGGAFLLYWDAEKGEITSYDGRETAPASAEPDQFLDANGEPLGFETAQIGGQSVGVPGVLRMLEFAHREHGRLPWSQLFDPAIRLSEGGFTVAPRLAAAIADNPALATLPATRAYFFAPDGSPLEEGDQRTNTEFAETLRMIGEQGADVFYEGELAADIIATVNADGIERMTAKDLRDYEAKKRAPVCGAYRDLRICGMGPPSSGGIAVVQMLGILNQFDLGALPPDDPHGLHLIAQAGRLAFADRDRYVADADFVEVPVETLVDARYLKDRARLVNREKDLGIAEPGAFAEANASVQQFEPVSTSHLTIVDEEGNIASMTTSIESAFGSHLMVDGFLLNNELTDFSFRPETDGKPVANRVEPGKRPRSSMSPTIVFDSKGKPILALGSPGGANIIGYVAQALVEIVDWNRTPIEAASAPHVINRNGKTLVEEGKVPETTLTELEKMGHTLDARVLESGLNIIAIEEGVLSGASDPRRDGVALGE